MSPAMVTGVRTGWMLLSSTRISRTRAHSLVLVARLFDFYLRLMLLSALNTRPSSFDLSALRCTAYNPIRRVIATSLG
jgi:hypothetical protein